MKYIKMILMFSFIQNIHGKLHTMPSFWEKLKKPSIVKQNYLI